jgi:hypothetical protein
LPDHPGMEKPKNGGSPRIMAMVEGDYVRVPMRSSHMDDGVVSRVLV